MKAIDEFVVSKHGIGWVDSDFKSRFGSTEFEPAIDIPTFQKLGKRMTDAEIESELKPGICTLGDVLAFIDNPPEGTKDSYANLFYTPSFVVSVVWDADRGVWGVVPWSRGGYKWHGGSRVFSPATAHSEPKPSELENSDTLTLERAIGIVVMAGWKVSR